MPPGRECALSHDSYCNTLLHVSGLLTSKLLTS